MNAIRLGVTLVGLNLVLRAAQIVFTENHMTEWWAIEGVRWSLLVFMVFILAKAITDLWTRVAVLEARVAEHDETMRELATEALFAKLELDVADIENYAQKP